MPHNDRQGIVCFAMTKEKHVNFWTASKIQHEAKESDYERLGMRLTSILKIASGA